MIKLARKLRRQQTETEQKLWSFLRSRQLQGYKFRRQYSIGNFIVDFCCFEKRLVVEVDGGQHIAQSMKDERRTKYLQDLGYRVLWFWDNEVLNETESVLERILLFLENPHASGSTRRQDSWRSRSPQC